MRSVRFFKVAVACFFLLGVGCERPGANTEKERRAAAAKAEKEAQRLARESQRQAKEALAERVDKSLRQLAERHKARLDWQESLTPRDCFWKVYTMDLHDALIKDPAQPVVFVARLLDVERRRDKYEVTLSFHQDPEFLESIGGDDTPMLDKPTLSIIVVLTCDQTLFHRLREKSMAWNVQLDLADVVSRNYRLGDAFCVGASEYAVVASLADLYKPTLALAGAREFLDAELEDIDVEAMAEVMLDVDSNDTYLARGTCLELVPIGELGK